MIFLIPYLTLDALSNVPVSIPHDKYIDRRKLSEQKNSFEYIVPFPSRGVGRTRERTFEVN